MTDYPSFDEMLGGERAKPELPEDLMQWVFDLDFMQQACGRRINTRYFCKALRDLREANYTGTAAEVRLAWQVLLDTVGPQLVGMFLRGKDWKRFTTPIHKDTLRTNTPSRVVVWESYPQGEGSTKVVVRRTFVGEVPTDLAFSVET